jgi:hypothetical protein
VDVLYSTLLATDCRSRDCNASRPFFLSCQHIDSQITAQMHQVRISSSLSLPLLTCTPPRTLNSCTLLPPCIDAKPSPTSPVHMHRPSSMHRRCYIMPRVVLCLDAELRPVALCCDCRNECTSSSNTPRRSPRARGADSETRDLSPCLAHPCDPQSVRRILPFSRTTRRLRAILRVICFALRASRSLCRTRHCWCHPWTDMGFTSHCLAQVKRWTS